MNGIKVHQLKTSRSYTDSDFAEELRSILRRSGCKGEKICFILDESNILESSFIERMNTLLANGEVPGLFEGDDYNALLTSCREGAQQQGLNLDTADELYKWFTKEVTKNLHVVFTMNPPSTDLSSAATTSPALFNRCVLNWMGDWSTKTLVQIAQELTSSVNLDMATYKPPDNATSSFRDAVSSTMVNFHEIVRFAGFQDQRSIGKTTTPGDYLDFLSHFVSIYRMKQEELDDEQRHLNVGLDKLKETVLLVDQLNRELAEKEKELKESGDEAKQILKKLIENQTESERKHEASINIQRELGKQKQAISERQEVVERDLANAEPAVLEAKRSVSNIKKNHLTELRSLANPPEAVKLTLESVCVLLGQKTSTWRDVQLAVRRDDFIYNIVNFDNETQMTPQLRRKMQSDYISKPTYNFETANRASKACGPLLLWVEAQVAYSTILEQVGPLRDELIKLERQQFETQAQAQVIAEMIKELEANIAKFGEEYQAKTIEVNRIRDSKQEVSQKVDRSNQLLKSLSAEKERWSGSISEFESRRKCLVGNSLLSAAAIAYTGYYDQAVRRHLRLSWQLELEKFNIPFDLDSSAKVSEYVTTSRQRLQWQDDQLPNDDLCIENAIMLDRYDRRYPFIIDPTGRIKEFLIRQHDGKRKLSVTSFLDASFVKHLESALRFGNPILIQDAEHFDPILAEVLNKEYRRTGGRTLIDLGRQEIDFSPDFKLFLFTRDPSVRVPPHISARTTIVNFTTTRTSVEAQSMDRVLHSERPEEQQKRKELIKRHGEYRVRLRELEVNLLQALNDSKGSILANDEVISTLETIKADAATLTQKVLEVSEVMAAIDKTADAYKELVRHCGIIHLLLQKAKSLHPFYQFSLEYFVRILDTVLQRKDHDGTSRASFLVKSLYIETYQRTAPAILKQHKASFTLVLLWAYSFEDISSVMDLFDDEAAGDVATRFRRVFDCTLDDTLLELAQKRHVMLDEITMDADTEGKSMPQNTTHQKLTTGSDPMLVRKLALLALVNKARFYELVDQVAVGVFGKEWEKVLDIKTMVCDQLDSATPVALCATEGSDPTYQIEAVVERTGTECEIIAMGSKESEVRADGALRKAMSTGTWVIVQNAHLTPRWLDAVQKTLEASSRSPNFRLFYTIRLDPSSQTLSGFIPTTLLLSSRILCFERSAGIRSGVSQSFDSVQPERLKGYPVERTRLYLLLSWLNSALQERLRYGRLGWKKPYDFNDSDFEMALSVIDRWVGQVAGGRTNVEPDMLPWDALVYLIGTIVYGGKVDDRSDKEIVKSLTSRILASQAYESDYELVEGDDRTKVPDSSSASAFVEWIGRLPEHEPSTWLGLPLDTSEERVRLEGKSTCHIMRVF